MKNRDYIILPVLAIGLLVCGVTLLAGGMQKYDAMLAFFGAYALIVAGYLMRLVWREEPEA